MSELPGELRAALAGAGTDDEFRALMDHYIAEMKRQYGADVPARSAPILCNCGIPRHQCSNWRAHMPMRWHIERWWSLNWPIPASCAVLMGVLILAAWWAA